MKKPLVDYRGLRLSNITDPCYSHLLWLLGWVGYFIAYALTERLIPAESCKPVHCFIDDIIPFNEVFIIPYVFWYFLIVFSLGYFALYNPESFVKLQKYIITVQVLATLCYVLFPSRQDLRPEFFPRENILTAIVGVIYFIDTNTGVCPSLHVAISLAMASVWAKEREAPLALRIFVCVAAAIICLSTMFVKQHSVLDFFAAIPICILAEYLVFGYKEKKATR